MMQIHIEHFILGAYDSAYRRTLRISYPFCAWVLDIMKGREEEGVIDKEQVLVEASIFREDIFSRKAVDHPAPVSSPATDKKSEEAILSEILSSEKDLQKVSSGDRSHN